MGSTSNLDKLIAESEEAIKRLDAIQQRKHGAPLWQRITRHFHKNSPHLLNVMLAGSVLVVAMGRLAQKHEHQAEKEQWEQQQQQLQGERQAAEARARSLLTSTDALVQGLEAAAADKSRRDLPQYVLRQLADWRRQAEKAQQELAGTPAAAAAAADGGSDGGGGGSKIMI